MVVDLGDGTFVLYGQPNRVDRRAEGDRAARGQGARPARQQGNGGSPHLHFHLMTGEKVVGADGVPSCSTASATLGQTDLARLAQAGLQGICGQPVRGAYTRAASCPSTSPSLDFVASPAAPATLAHRPTTVLKHTDMPPAGRTRRPTAAEPGMVSEASTAAAAGHAGAARSSLRTHGRVRGRAHHAGALGIVINRPSEMSVDDAKEWGSPAAPPTSVFVGGPVQVGEAVIGTGRTSARRAPGWEPLLGRIGTVDLAVPPLDAHPAMEEVRGSRAMPAGARPARRRARPGRVVRGRRRPRRPAHGGARRALAPCCAARAATSRWPPLTPATPR